MGIITAVSATGLAAGLALTGAHLAGAGTGTSTSPTAGSSASAGLTLPPGGVLEHRVTRFCNRVPTLIQRADKAEARLNADADTKGSLARLKAREAKVKANPRLDRRIARRTARLAKLPQVKTRLSKAKAECGTLERPTPSAAPSTS